MKRPEPAPSNAAASLRLLAIVFTAIILPLVVWGAGPAWWTQHQPPVITSGATADDYAAVNQGQVKNIVKAAADELDAHLPGGAGPTLQTLLALWATPATTGTAQTDDFIAINLGQLKNVAKPVYDRLLASGYLGHPLQSGTYPWVGGSPDDYAAANAGQVKNLFSFDLLPPHVEITLPSNGAIVSPANFSITATASVQTGSIASLHILDGSDDIAESASGSLTVAPTNPVRGNHLLTAKATDSRGIFSVSQPVSVLVDTRPEVTGTSMRVIGDVSTVIRLPGLDADNDPLIYTITQPPTKGTLSELNSSTGTLTYKPNENATTLDEIKFKVNDGFLDSGEGTISLAMMGRPILSLDVPGHVWNGSFTVSGGATNPNGHIQSMQVFDAGTPIAPTRLIGVPSVGATLSNCSIEFNWLASGAHPISVVATDDFGITGVSNTITLIKGSAGGYEIKEYPADINVTIISTGCFTLGDMLVATGTNISLSVSVVGGTVGQVDYYDGNQLIGTTETATSPINYTIATSGTHKLTAVARSLSGELIASCNSLRIIAASKFAIMIETPPKYSVCDPGAITNFPAVSVVNPTGINLYEVDWYINGYWVGFGTDPSNGYSPYVDSYFTSNYPGKNLGEVVITAKGFYSGGLLDAVNAPIIFVKNTAPVQISTPVTQSVYNNAQYVNFEVSDPAYQYDAIYFYDGNRYMGASFWNTTLNRHDFWGILANGVHSVTAMAPGHPPIGAVTPVIITVLGNAPCVQITAPGSGVIPVGQQIVLSATAGATEGNINSPNYGLPIPIERVDYFEDEMFIGSSMVPPYNVSYQPLVGSHALKAVATARSQTGSSPVVAISVISDLSVSDGDRDGYPDVYEDVHNARRLSAESIPAPDIVVDPEGAIGAYRTITDAVAAVTADYQIIKVNPGFYRENVSITDYKVLLISSSGAACTVLSGTYGGSAFAVSNDSIINGFTISNRSADTYYKAEKGGGVLIQGGSPRFTNCIISSNRASSGAAIHSSGNNPVFLNCTIAHNTSDSGEAISIVSGSMTLTNSIVWNPGVRSEISGTAVGSCNDVRGGLTGVGNLYSDPLLTVDSHLVSSSPCVGAANNALAPLLDMDGEARGETKSDIGADELALPAWWQLQFFGHLGVDPYEDHMGDGITNLQKWELGLDPTQYHYSAASSDSAPEITIIKPIGVELINP